jgi:hypothetical protein
VYYAHCVSIEESWKVYVQQQKLSPLMSLSSAEMQWFLAHVKCVGKEGHKGTTLPIGTIYLRY